MTENTRREFLSEVGRGMLIASLGPSLCADLCLAQDPAGGGSGGSDELTFGELEPWVALMQETAPDELLAVLAKKLASGTELRTLVAAGALANARTFGGHDYDGYHAFMAMMPAYQMAQELPEAERPLPVLKVLYRSTARIRTHGGRARDVLRVVEPKPWPDGVAAGRALRDAVFAHDVDRAERTFAQIAKRPPSEAYDALLPVVRGDVDVHRIVIAWRAWDLRRLTGEEHAHTLLRQSVRYCVDSERGRANRNQPEPGIRSALPRLLEQHGLLDGPRGTENADDARVDELASTIFSADRETAAAAAAAALADGLDPEVVGEAISLAANKLLLHDPGRQGNFTAEKPRGSVHGASVGVHASDAANAWRNVARVSGGRNTAASLIVGAYHTAGQIDHVGSKPIPFREKAEAVEETDAAALLRAAEAAFRGSDQVGACASVERYAALDHPSAPVFDLMRRYAISEDGALHAEKYFRTVTEEFAATRPALRWRHLVGLARVTASQYGHPAPGVARARQLLKV